ncbi:MAG: Gfo/Idh/MocA family protein [Candidatus Aminicenantales bacterium]
MKRRDFLKKLSLAAAGTFAAPAIIPSPVLGKGKAVPPSNRIVMAGIGFGMMGIPNMKAFLEKKEVQWVAVCDVDENHLRQARDIVNQKYGNRDCATYKDFRELCQRTDIDAVSIALPDHWHAIPAIECARAGFDIYGEKPLSHSLLEGRAMCEAVKRYSRIWQTGSWQRSVENFHHACELVRNGRMGKILKVEVGLPSGHYDFAGTKGQEKIGPPPSELDYDFWVGPAPYSPYCPAKVHRNWRWVMDFGGGQLMDWVGHHVDIAHWGLGFDLTGPVEIEGWGEFPRRGVWNSPTRYYLKARYADGTPMDIAGGHEEIRPGTKWIGEYGWIWVNRGGLEAHPQEILNERIGPNEIRLYRSRDHYQNFLDCVKSRRQTITPIEVAHRSASVGHLGGIAMELGRKIRFNPEKEEIIGDAEAARLLGRSYRSPWQLGL